MPNLSKYLINAVMREKEVNSGIFILVTISTKVRLV